MKAWVIDRTVSTAGRASLRLADLAPPVPSAREVRLRVLACGVCRTDLHLIDGDLPAHQPRVVPGHEIVGVVDGLGDECERFRIGERVGVAWLRGTCGACRFCIRGDENLCLASCFTGWDADGGYAEHAVIDERFAYPLPAKFSDRQAAPLLCAGIIGYRALRRAALPPRGRLGIYGFGASAHITAQLALAEGATVHVMTRSPEARELALRLGASSAGDTFDPLPEPLDSAIIFAPAGEIVPSALAALDRGGTLAVAGIHLSDIPSLRYADHLFQERQIRSVTANTRRDGEEFLELAARLDLHLETVPYPFERADEALADLAADRVTGAAVLMIGSASPGGDELLAAQKSGEPPKGPLPLPRPDGSRATSSHGGRPVRTDPPD